MSHTIPKAKARNPIQNLSKFRRDPLQFLIDNYAKYGDIFQFNVLRRTLVATNNPDHVKHILQDNNKNYKKSPAYDKLSLALGNGLFTSEGDFWLRQRRMSAPAFHKKEIEAYQQIMLEETTSMLDQWQDQEEVNISAAMTHLTLKIISRALLGLSLDDDKGKIVEQILPPGLKFLIDRIQQPLSLPLWFPTESHKMFNNSMRTLREIIDELIRSKEKEPGKDDLLSRLIAARDDEGKGMTHQQLQDEVLTFFLAGHETTAVSSTWSIWLLKDNPAEEQKFLSAVDNEEDDYIMATIQESMRLLSPVWLLGRQSIKEDMLGELPIAKGQTVIFSPLLMHKDPKHWTDPEAFRPERFLAESERPKYAYYPFGGGPRLCIGNHFALQELRIILTEIFKRYSLTLVNKEFPGADYTLTLRPAKPIYAKIQLR